MKTERMDQRRRIDFSRITPKNPENPMAGLKHLIVLRTQRNAKKQTLNDLKKWFLATPVEFIRAAALELRSENPAAFDRLTGIE